MKSRKPVMAGLISTLSGGGTAATTTQHNHVYGGANHYTTFTGVGAKTSYSGLSSSSSWSATTNNPASAQLQYATDGCAAKPA